LIERLPVSTHSFELKIKYLLGGKAVYTDEFDKFVPFITHHLVTGKTSHLYTHIQQSIYYTFKRQQHTGIIIAFFLTLIDTVCCVLKEESFLIYLVISRFRYLYVNTLAKNKIKNKNNFFPDKMIL
jgi:hypothetical protein